MDAQRKRLGELDTERLEALRNANNGSLSSDEKDEAIAYITADKTEIQENIDKLEEQQHSLLEPRQFSPLYTYAPIKKTSP